MSREDPLVAESRRLERCSALAVAKTRFLLAHSRKAAAASRMLLARTQPPGEPLFPPADWG